MRKTLFIIFSVLILISSVKLNAQIFQLNEADIEVEMIPSRPRANQNVSVKIASYIIDINSSYITWNLNGKTVSSGNGVKNFSFTTGDNNTTTSLVITVRTSDGQSVEKKISFKPTDVDLIWQSEGYTPPFYKGKSLFSYQNKITFIAYPHITNQSGVEINPKNLVYKWTKDGKVVDDSSGYGKNTFTFLPPVISRPLNVTVEVTSPNDSSSGFARVNVSPIEPTLLFYIKNPIYGIEFQKALQNNIKLANSKEVAVIGVPYYFGVTNTESSDLVYKWSINGAEISNVNTNIQIFRPKEGTSGSSNISLSIENTQKILQYARNMFSLEFGEPVTNTATF